MRPTAAACFVRVEKSTPVLPPAPCWEQTPETHALTEFLLCSSARMAFTNARVVVSCYRSGTGRTDMPGGRPAKKPRTAAASATRWHACGSGAAAAAAASEGGMAEVDIEDELAFADEAQSWRRAGCFPHAFPTP